MTCGRKLSATMSAQRTSGRITSAARGWLRSTDRLSFELLKSAKKPLRLSPGLPPLNGPPSRTLSGWRRDSILMTVAPLSDSCLVMIGPAAAQVKSATFESGKELL